MNLEETPEMIWDGIYNTKANNQLLGTRTVNWLGETAENISTGLDKISKEDSLRGGLTRMGGKVLEGVDWVNEKTGLEGVSEAASKALGNVAQSKGIHPGIGMLVGAVLVPDAVDIATLGTGKAAKIRKLGKLGKIDDLAKLGQDIKKGTRKAPEVLHDWTNEISQLVKEGKLSRAPHTRFESIALGTSNFDDVDGINRMIRRFRSEKLPLGRTEQTILRPKQRGMTKRLNLEETLTLGKDKGFYVNTPTGSHAHHWNPLAVLGKVTDGMPKKAREGFLKNIQDELVLFSGNHIGNLRQLPSEVHTKLHQMLDKLGYNPQRIKSFKGKSLAERKAFIRKFNQVLAELEGELFNDVMKYKHGSNWPTKIGPSML